MDDLALVNQVKTTYIGDQRVHIAAADRSFEADQRTQLDRPGAGFCPLELVAAALGAWMVLTMAAVADNKGIKTTRLEAAVEGRTEFVGRQTATCFLSRLDLGEGLTPREQRILYNSARTCEVHKMLRGEVTFEDHLVGMER